MVTVNLAAGLVACTLWRLLLAEPTRDLLPCRLRRRVPSPPPARVTAPAIAAVVVALVLGAATHVLWDTFTHRHRWGVDTLPGVFYAEFALPGVGVWAVYKLFQHGSSLIGLPLLAVWIARTLWRAPIFDAAPGFTITPIARRAVWTGLALVPVTAAASVLVVDDSRLAWQLHHGATRTGAAVAMGLVLYAGVWQFARHRPARVS